MADTTISISVNQETAQAYSAMSAESQKKVQILLNFHIQEILSNPPISLKNLMDDLGTKAEARGLNAEILETLLSDE